MLTPDRSHRVAAHHDRDHSQELRNIMEYAVHHVRRPGLTRDLPYGPDDLF
nr:hypothetical protein [uncultured Actinoplanes sp.]